MSKLARAYVDAQRAVEEYNRLVYEAAERADLPEIAIPDDAFIDHPGAFCAPPYTEQDFADLAEWGEEE